MLISPKKVLENNWVFANDAKGKSTIVLDGPNNQLQPNGIDLRLAKAYKIVGAVDFNIDKNRTVKPNLIEMQQTNGAYLFQPGNLYSIDFVEDVVVPDNVAAHIIHRSTINRFSSTVISGLFDSGFTSKNGCGAMLRPDLTTKIQVGFRLAQIVFYEASSAHQYDGQYQQT